MNLKRLLVKHIIESRHAEVNYINLDNNESGGSLRPCVNRNLMLSDMSCAYSISSNLT